jgi:hypothetical protein
MRQPLAAPGVMLAVAAFGRPAGEAALAADDRVFGTAGLSETRSVTTS